MNKITIQFKDADDKKWFLSYVQKAKASEGTVSGLYCVLMCSALKRAAVKDSPSMSRKSLKALTKAFDNAERS